MPEFAVTSIGRDRPGIVAAISGALHELGGNIEDSRMAILGGHFAVMLIVEVPEDVGAERLETRLAEASGELGLDAIAVNAVASSAESARPTHVVSVYGADHPGIVHAVSAALAGLGVNVTDLQTRATKQAEKPLYVMLMEVSLGGADPDRVREALRAAGEHETVEVSLRELGGEAL
jgi:glycine cleavage system transcriptional repressor